MCTWVRVYLHHFQPQFLIQEKRMLSGNTIGLIIIVVVVGLVLAARMRGKQASSNRDDVHY